jgi:hypothetical protein
VREVFYHRLSLLTDDGDRVPDANSAGDGDRSGERAAHSGDGPDLRCKLARPLHAFLTLGHQVVSLGYVAPVLLGSFVVPHRVECPVQPVALRLQVSPFDPAQYQVKA